MMENLGFYAKSGRLKRFLTIFSLVLLGCGLLLVLILVVWIVNSHYGKRYNSRSKETHKYKSFRYNPSKNETSSGFVQIFEELKSDVHEFISYQDNEEGDYYLISNLESPNFVCSGSCFCENEEGRRAQTSVITSRVLYFLLAASSSLLAMDAAKDYFDGECRSTTIHNDDTCQVIHSKVDDCEETIPSKTGEEEEELLLDSSNTEFGEERLFICSGRCIPTYKYAGDQFSDDFKKKFIEFNSHICENTDLEILISNRDFHTPCARNDMIVSDIDCAVIEFLERHLTESYCLQANFGLDVGGEKLLALQKTVPVCIPPQMFGEDQKVFSEQLVEAKVECNDLMRLGSLNCEHEHRCS